MTARGFIVEAAALGGLWLALSGHYDAFHLGLGVVSVGLVIWLNSSGPATGGMRIKGFRALVYFMWLVMEIVTSALHVARVVLSPKMPLDPSIVRFTSIQPNDAARVILGNSITVTPGTLTLDINGDQFVVHALTKATARALLAGSMQRRVSLLFQRTAGPEISDVERSQKT